MALLRFTGVVKSYAHGPREVTVLDEVDLEVDAREHVALVGPSGSGKSTLLHLAGGLDTPSRGSVFFAGDDLGGVSSRHRARLRRRQIGFVFQFFHLLPALTVAENIGLPLLLDGRRSALPSELLERLGIAHLLRRVPAELSGGEMQRVAIARALVPGPTLVLADEPTGNLDSTSGAAVLDLLGSAVDEAGAALILATHDDRAVARAHRVLHLRDGRLAGVAPRSPIPPAS